MSGSGDNKMIPNRVQTIFDVTRKEISEHFKTKRLLVISIIFAAVMLIISIYGGYLVGGGDTDEPTYEGGANQVLALTLAFSTYFPPILAIALGYDTIVGERTRRSLHLVLSKPVDRSSVYLGKFLGAFLSIAMVYLVVGTVGYVIVIGLSGQVPSLTEVGRAYGAMGVILFSAACWVLFVMLFSTSFKTVTSTIIFSVMFWLFILNIASQAGYIYFSISQASSDETIAVDIINLGGQVDENSTTIMFWAHNFGTPSFSVEYELRDEAGKFIEPVRGSSIFSLFKMYPINYGNYSWKALQIDSQNEKMEEIANGDFYFGPEFFPYVQLSSFDNDSLYNDVILTMGQTSFDSNIGFDLTVTSMEDDSIVESITNYTGVYLLKNLAQGDFQITIKRDNFIVFDTIVHSFGKEEPAGQMFLVNSDDVDEYPAYVKITWSMNPDRTAMVYLDVITGEDGASGGIISVQEGLIALSIECIGILLLGLFIFSRIELL